MGKNALKDLLGDASDGENDGDAGDSLGRNKEFARRFEHNNRRTELHRLQAKHPELARRIEREELRAAARGDVPDDDETSESSDDEDDGVLSVAAEKEWAEALLKIKRKDPSIYDASTKLFTEVAESDGSGDERDEDQPEGTKKGKTLREILYSQAVEDQDLNDEDLDNIGTDGDRRNRLRHERHANMAYDDEQKNLRTDLLSKLRDVDADHEADGDGGLIKKTKASITAVDGGEEDGDAEEVQNMLDAYFDKRVNKDKGDDFLRKFLVKRMWDDNDEAGDDGDEDDDGASDMQTDAAAKPAADDEEDAEFLDHADDFERQYNFRSEEPGGHIIATFPRVIENTARKETSKRKRQREAKQERVDSAKKQKETEVKQLKNLKKKQVQDTLGQLRAVAGKAAPNAAAMDALMNSDFDPDAWDKHMAAAFDDEYYDEAERADDVDDQETDELIKNWKPAEAGDGSEDGEGQDDDTFDAVHRRVTGVEDTSLPDNDYDIHPADPSDNDDGDDEDTDAPVDHEALKASRDKIRQLMEQYFELDYEDNIGGIKTRFRYRQVEPVRDGLDTTETLALTDRELNQVVGLRRMAPYIDDASRIRPNYKALTEAKTRLHHMGVVSRMESGQPSTQKKPRNIEPKSSAAAAKDTTKSEKPQKVSSVDKKVSGKGKAEPADVQAAAVTSVKSKRPGPALRRALKAAKLAAENGTPEHVAEGNPVAEKVSTTSTPANNVAVAGKVHAKKAGKRNTSGAEPEPEMTPADARKKRRMESYARMQLHKNAPAVGTPSHTEEVVQAKQPATPSSEPTGLSKSQKKNMKRNQSRKSQGEGKTPEAAAV